MNRHGELREAALHRWSDAWGRQVAHERTSRGRLDGLTPPPHVIEAEFKHLRAHGGVKYEQIAQRLGIDPDYMLTLLRRRGVEVNTATIGGWT